MRSDGTFEIMLLTGFLGSGKTTLLKSFLSASDASHIAVVVNEIGEIDVDGAVLTQTAKKVPVAVLSNGCICCAGNGDLAGTIAMLQEERLRLGMPALERIIVETSGAARPGPVLRSLKLLGAHARTCCVATFDARDWRRALKTREGRSQIAGAHRIVITKIDSVSDSETQDAVAAARASNTLAELISAPNSQQRALSALTEFTYSLGDISAAKISDEGHSEADKRITTAVLRFSNTIEYDELAEWLDNAAGLFGDRLYRIKGTVRSRGTERHLLVQGVGTTFAPLIPLPIDGTQSFLVVIGEQLALKEIQSIEPFLPGTISMGGFSQSSIGRALPEVLNECRAALQ